MSDSVMSDRCLEVFDKIARNHTWDIFAELRIILEQLVANPDLLPLMPKNDKIAQDFGKIIELSHDESVTDDQIGCEFYKMLQRLSLRRSRTPGPGVDRECSE